MSVLRVPVSQSNCLITRQGARRADVGIWRLHVGMFSFIFFRLIEYELFLFGFYYNSFCRVFWLFFQIIIKNSEHNKFANESIDQGSKEAFLLFLLFLGNSVA